MAATSFFSVFWQNSKHFKAFALRSSSPNFDLDFHYLFPLSPRNLEKSEKKKKKKREKERTATDNPLPSSLVPGHTTSTKKLKQ